MAESKRVKAEEAEEKNLNVQAEGTAENAEVETSSQEEEIGAEEPLEIFSTADDQMYLNEKGEFNWDAYEAAGGYNNDERKKLDKMYEATLSVIRERERMVFSWARWHDLPVAWVLAGGYPSATFTIDDVARLHRITAEESARAYG